jgi:hypothetical protein
MLILFVCLFVCLFDDDDDDNNDDDDDDYLIELKHGSGLQNLSPYGPAKTA